MLALSEFAMSWYQPPSMPASARAAMNAKSLRRTLTEPENRLRWHLRNRLSVEDTHFRRQVAVGSHVADFCGHGAKLVRDADRGQHATDDAIAYDNRRTACLTSRGFLVLRSSNADVMQNMNVLLDTFHAAFVRTTPTPNLSPQGGGEMEM